jgi:hypothetical protein
VLQCNHNGTHFARALCVELVASIFPWKCINKVSGCTVKCKIDEMRQHVSNCEYRIRPCFIHLEGCSGVRYTVSELCKHLREQHHVEVAADESSVFSKAGMKLKVNRSDDYDTEQYNNIMLVRDEGLVYFICVMQMDSTNGICIIAMLIDDKLPVPTTIKSLRVSIGAAPHKKYTQCYPVVHIHEVKGRSFDEMFSKRELIYIEDSLIKAVSCPNAKHAEICISIQHDSDL